LVQWAQVFELPSFIPITVNGGGTLDLTGSSEDIGTSLTLNDGGSVITGTGTLSLAAGATVAVSGTPASTISGNLNIGSGTFTLAISNSLYIPANVSGSATILKIGSSDVRFQGTNSYSGLTIISEGHLWAQNAFALGTTANGTVVSNGASLVLLGSFGNHQRIAGAQRTGREFDLGRVGRGDGSRNQYLGRQHCGECRRLHHRAVLCNTSLRIIGVMNGVGGVTKFANSAGKLYYEGPSNDYLARRASLREHFNSANSGVTQPFADHSSLATATAARMPTWCGWAAPSSRSAICRPSPLIPRGCSILRARANTSDR